MNEEWKPGTVVLRHVDKKGTGYVETHRCWNKERFLHIQLEAAAIEGGRIELVSKS